MGLGISSAVCSIPIFDDPEPSARPTHPRTRRVRKGHGKQSLRPPKCQISTSPLKGLLLSGGSLKPDILFEGAPSCQRLSLHVGEAVQSRVTTSEAGFLTISGTIAIESKRQLPEDSLLQETLVLVVVNGIILPTPARPVLAPIKVSIPVSVGDSVGLCLSRPIPGACISTTQETALVWSLQSANTSSSLAGEEHQKIRAEAASS